MTDERLRNELKHLDHIMDRAIAPSDSGDLVQAERPMEELQRCNALMLRRLENVAWPPAAQEVDPAHRPLSGRLPPADP
jgi:hypothetical protein